MNRVKIFSKDSAICEKFASLARMNEVDVSDVKMHGIRKTLRNINRHERVVEFVSDGYNARLRRLARPNWSVYWRR